MDNLENLVTDTDDLEVLDAEHEEVVASPTGDDEENEILEEEGENKDEVAEHSQSKKKQSHADNAVAKAARIRAQQETQDRMKEQYDNEIAGFGIPNPYTGKPFRSFKEFLEYGEKYKKEQLEARAEKEGKSVEELREEEENRSYISQKRREDKLEKEKMKALKEQNEFLKKDIRTFKSKYPDIDIAKLEKNLKFKKFCGKRLYKESILDLYEDFTELISDAEAIATAKATTKTSRSTGSGNNGLTNVTLTAEQKAQLEEWNSENPHLKMTAKEFFER